MTSFSQDDITNLNNANSVAKHSRHYGWKTGAARCTFTATGGKAIGTHGLGLTIPKGSLVTRAYYKVLTTFTSASADAGTIALQVAGANDLVTATAISAGGDIWDAGGGVMCAPGGDLSDEVDVTADSEVSAVVGTAALTAGKLVLWIEWAYYGDLDLT